MKPSLSLRVSQHLALTPQLQQSIRLLQLSTLELSQEIEQMLQDNPFLELSEAELSPAERTEIERSLRHDELLVQEDREDQMDAAWSEPSASQTAHEASPDTPADAASALSDGRADVDDLHADGPYDWEGDGSASISADDSEWGVESAGRGPGAVPDDEANDWSGRAAPTSLAEHLRGQALGMRLSAQDRLALEVLIDSLDDDGYLADSLSDIALSLGPVGLEESEELLARLSVALKWLQSMEPVGVGARDLAECLRLQLCARSASTEGEVESEAVQAARLVLAQPLELLARRDVRRLAQLCRLSTDALKAAFALIQRLEPKPGRSFYLAERNIVVPDVIVSARSQRAPATFAVRLNPDVMPRMHLNDAYASVLKSSPKTEAITGLQGKLQEARWFIKNVQQRFDTILRVSQAIVARQEPFFREGAVAMRPLVLREIADEIGMHESTISRVTTAKYMATPWGTFELKYFFGSGLNTEAGSNASSTAVRELIKRFIEAESKAKPLSDSSLADLLKAQGIDCARRTVAKYRESLRIPVASLRKSLSSSTGAPP